MKMTLCWSCKGSAPLFFGIDKIFKFTFLICFRCPMETTEANQVYAAVLHVLMQDRDGKVETLLKDILEWEKTHPPTSEYDGFEWYQVHADPRTLNKMVRQKEFAHRLKTNKCITYRAMEIKALEKALDDYEGTLTQIEEAKGIPPDLFSIIIGHEDKKELIMRSIEAEKPVHFILWGTPASAKSLMLEELDRLPQSRFILGSNLTKAGIFEVLFYERPRFLIIDELDKIKDAENLSILLSLMARGFISETKHRRDRHLRLKTWVFASANEVKRVPRELMSRFQPLLFKDYTDDEFYEVVVRVLHEREDTTKTLAVYIAEKVLILLKSRDVRDSVKVARLLKQKTKKDVDHIISIMKKQK